MAIKTKLRSWISEQANDPAKKIARFTRGGFVFTFGTLIVIYAESNLYPSLKQELTALFGMALVCIGLLLALSGYLGLSVFKILDHMISKQSPKEPLDDDTF